VGVDVQWVLYLVAAVLLGVVAWFTRSKVIALAWVAATLLVLATFVVPAS
jgi:hypothetical protein